jgi:hypothetical protein
MNARASEIDLGALAKEEGPPASHYTRDQKTEDLLYCALDVAMRVRVKGARLEPGTAEWMKARRQYEIAIESARMYDTDLRNAGYGVSELVEQMLRQEGLR